jgi:hypothetical protein
MKEGRGGIPLAPVHRRPKAATRHKKTFEGDRVCGFRSRMGSIRSGMLKRARTLQEVRQINGVAFKTSLQPYQPYQWTALHGTIPDVRHRGSEGSDVMPVAKLNEISISIGPLLVFSRLTLRVPTTRNIGRGMPLQRQIQGLDPRRLTEPIRTRPNPPHSDI